MRLRPVSIALCVSLAVLAGCGSQDPEEQISALMTELREVQDAGDAERACEEVYVVQERVQPPGEENSEREREEERSSSGEARECQPAFEQAVEQRRANLKSLETELVRVDVEDGRGTAVLHTTATRADGSSFERDVPYDVVRTRAGWRVRISPEG